MKLSIRNKLNSGWQVLDQMYDNGEIARWTNIKKRALNPAYVNEYNQSSDEKAKEKALNVLTDGRHNDEWVSEIADRAAL